MSFSEDLAKIALMPEGPEKVAALQQLAVSSVIKDDSVPSEMTPLQSANSNISLLQGAATSGGNAATYASQKNYVGATLSGAAAGAAIGQLAIPIPGLGAGIGALVGGAAGAIGTAASKDPEEKKDPLEEERKRLANEYQQKVNIEMQRKMNRQANIRTRLLYR